LIEDLRAARTAAAIEAGEVKLDGKWMWEKAKNEGYQTDALRAFNHMKEVE
jgi:hypothetical protein